jgi:curved DNA-binding protein CbpA
VSHYDTLGVPTNATPDEIKSGYRKAAAKAHPDKGGSNEKMAEVNRAYQVLSNQEARVHYDQFGEDPGAPKDAATDMLMVLFDLAINACDGDVVKFVLGRLKDAVEELEQKREMCQRTIKKLQKKAGRVKTKGTAPNLFQMLLDKKISDQQSLLSNIARTAADVNAARALMDHYESGYVEPIKPDPRASDMEMLVNLMDLSRRAQGRKPW